MTMLWGSVEVPMKLIDATPTIFTTGDSKSVLKATSRLTEMLNANYKAADLPTLVSQKHHLSATEQS